MARPIKDNKDNKSVFQSYVLTAARYDLNIYEKRIVYNIIEVASQELQEKLKNGKISKLIGFKVQPTLFGKQITIPIKRILANEEDKNYTAAKKALKSLALKGIEYEDEKQWSFTNIISNPNIDKTGGFATFDVHNAIWECCWNFAKGYRKLEFKTIMQFRSIYTMRFYELMSGQKNPLKYRLEELRDMLKLDNKFARTEHFERKVLEVAKAELDEYSPYSFRYERMTIPSRGRTGEKVVGYTFYPQHIHKNEDMKLEEKSLLAQIPISNLIPRQVYDYLLSKGLTKEQLNANKAAIHDFVQSSPDVLGQIAIAWGRARGKEREVGYFINTLKGMTKDNLKGK